MAKKTTSKDQLLAATAELSTAEKFNQNFIETPVNQPTTKKRHITKRQYSMSLSITLHDKIQAYKRRGGNAVFLIEEAVAKSIRDYEDKFGKLTEEDIILPSEQ